MSVHPAASPASEPAPASHPAAGLPSEQIAVPRTSTPLARIKPALLMTNDGGVTEVSSA